MTDPIEEADKIGGWMTKDELKWLYDRASESNTVLEIGSWMGKSTYALCSGCKGNVFSVDHFLGSSEHKFMIERGCKPFDVFKENVKKFANLITLKMSSEEASKALCIPEKFDMLFIDGAHEYEDFLLDLKCWTDRARRLLCGHDANYPSIQKAFGEMFPDKKMEWVPSTTIWFMEMK